MDDYDRAGAYLTTSQIQSEAPHFDSVWGAFFPSTWRTYNSHILLTRYYMPYEDNSLVSGATHTLSWFQTNEKSWILYGCQANGTQTTDYAWSGTGFNDVPLDIHNSAVVKYQLGTIVSYLRAHSTNGVAIDNVTFENTLMSPNKILEGKQPVLGSPAPGNSWYGCGVYTQGPSVPNSFVRRYSAGFDEPDTAFIADLENWIHQAKGTLAPYGLKVIVNHAPFSASPNSNELTMISNIDGMVDENGFTKYGTEIGGALFANTLNWMLYLQSHGKAVFITDYFCKNGVNPATGKTCTTTAAPGVTSLTAQQIDWGLATYALGNNGGADVYISPKGGADYVWRSEYARQYGAACGAYSKVGTAYVRKFADGYAAANPPGGTTQHIALPAHSYSDIEGRGTFNGGTLTVNPGDAYMLLTTANTCS